MKKIALVAVNASFSHSSLALRYIRATLQHCLKKSCADSDISICEYTINDRTDNIVMALYHQQADIYAFSCYIWNIRVVLDISQKLKLAMPDCTIIFGGPEVSYDAKTVMGQHSFVDYIICGEGEGAFAKLAQRLGCLGECSLDAESLQVELSQIEGIVYRKGGKVIQNPTQIVHNLDTLPKPYTKEDIQLLHGKIIYYETSRGCPYNCSYCLSSTIHGVRFFGLERVFEDLAMFIDSGVSLVKFVDRTFNADQCRSIEILKFILKKGGKTCFHFEIAAHLLSDEIIAILRGAPVGMFQLEIGVQSTNMQTIHAIDRTTDFGKLCKNVGLLLENRNIHLHLDLIAGLPFEDYSSFEKSFDDVFALRPNALQLGFLKLLKGSKIRGQAAEYEYKFADIAPYEVIANRWMSFDDIVCLKGIEDIVERYYNSGVFGRSLPYVMRKSGQGSFRFFGSVAKYWQCNGLDQRHHSRQQLYTIFYEFCTSIFGEHDLLFCDLLKLDFMTHNKGASLPHWAQRTGEKSFYNAVSAFLKDGGTQKYLPHMAHMTPVDILKHIKVERFNFDVCGTLEFGQNAVIIDYTSKKCIKIYEKF